MKLTATLLQLALFKQCNARARMCCPNTDLGFGEADFLAVTASRFLIEYEIKLTTADFRREFVNPRYSKANKHAAMQRAMAGNPRKRDASRGWFGCPNRYYFVAPSGVIAPGSVPAHCGIITAINGTRSPWPVLVEERRAPLLHSDKTTDEVELRLGRGMMFRWFMLREREWRAKAMRDGVELPPDIPDPADAVFAEKHEQKPELRFES